MNDDATLVALFKRLLEESYVDTESPSGNPRFCVDGTLHDVTEEEYAALERLFSNTERNQ